MSIIMIIIMIIIIIIVTIIIIVVVVIIIIIIIIGRAHVTGIPTIGESFVTSLFSFRFISIHFQEEKETR